MSFFRPYNYRNKPDLPENVPAKNGFFQFWELYFRKFWRFVTLNFYYFLLTLPLLMLAFFTANGFYISLTGNADTVLFRGVTFIFYLFGFVPKQLYVPLVILSALVYGPATMGLTYILRNFARQEHAWTSDFWSRGVSNFRQGLFFGLADILVAYVLFTGMFGGMAAAGKTVGYALSVILAVLSAVVFVIWAFMRHYTYLMAVTVELGVFAILKNAWLFTVLGFGRNILSGLVTLVCIVVCFMLAPLVTVVSLPLFFYTLSWFATVYICYPIIKKYIIVPALEAEKNKSE
jgi:hypothetical protein